MKVLFCAPFKEESGVVKGGIHIWANNILQYYKTVKGDIEIIPVSFDRHFVVRSSTSLMYRLIWGIRDYLVSVREVRCQLKRCQIDVLHLCSSAQLGLFKDLLVLKLAKRKGVKTVIHFHFGRIPEIVHQNGWEYRLIKRVCTSADRIIVMDQRSHDALLSVGFKQVHNVPNPISIDIIQSIETLTGEILRQPRKIVFVGQVIKTKGIVELVEACKQLKGVRLSVIGKGNPAYIEGIRSMASLSDKENWLTFTGSIEHVDVLREMMSASVFVLPSYTEGFPNVILEAMACGCPIVATNVGAIPEMLEDENGNHYGICVNPKDVPSLKNGISAILSNPESAINCAQKAKERVKNLYAIPVVWTKLCQIWETINH